MLLTLYLIFLYNFQIFIKSLPHSGFIYIFMNFYRQTLLINMEKEPPPPLHQRTPWHPEHQAPTHGLPTLPQHLPRPTPLPPAPPKATWVPRPPKDPLINQRLPWLSEVQPLLRHRQLWPEDQRENRNQRTKYNPTRINAEIWRLDVRIAQNSDA